MKHFTDSVPVDQVSHPVESRFFSSRVDVLDKYRDEIDFIELVNLRQSKEAIFVAPYWCDLVKDMEFLARTLEGGPLSNSSVLDVTYCSAEGMIKVGEEEWLDASGHELLQSIITRLRPWRKGPISLCGHFIDSEWRSNLKWDRVALALGDIRGARILDLGCSNGYYMFRLAELDPAVVIGIDPSERCLLSFDLIQMFCGDPRLAFEVLRSEHLAIFPQFFDVALCMGVVYHVRDPLSLLKQLLNSIKPGGMAIVESQVIDLPGPYALCPNNRYTKSHNMYFIPTAECLVSWLEKVGFVDCKVVAIDRVTSEEQRRTVDAPFESLDDFLDPHNRDLTVEGYPAPHRAVVKAWRKG